MLDEACVKGKHPLEVIFGTYGEYNGSRVVRWCSSCGAIVIDLEVDGRVMPGGIMSMRRPEISKANSQSRPRKY